MFYIKQGIGKGGGKSPGETNTEQKIEHWN